MNIAILVPSFPPGPASGAELQAQGWAERLSATHKVSVITSRQPPSLPATEIRDGYTVYRGNTTTPVPWLRTHPRALLRSIAPPRVRRWMRKETHSRETTRQLGLFEQRPDLLLCFMSESGFGGVAVGERHGIPAVVWIRNESEYRLHSPRDQRILPDMWARAAAVCVQTASGRDGLLTELQRVAPALLPVIQGKLEVIGNGVDLPELEPLVADGPVLSVGRLVPHKGMDVVIEACAALGRPLVIAGCGPERTALEKQASALGAEVRFVGFVDRDTLSALYRSASAVVLASQYEGLPNVVLEAMAHGRPVVATPRGGVTELIVDGVSGLLVPPGDPPAVAAALDRIYAEPETAAELAANARTTAEAFAWERLQPKLEEALERWRCR